MDNQLRYQASSDSASMSAKSPPEGASWRDFITVTKPGIIRSNLIAAFAGYWVASGWDVQYGRLILTLLGTMLVMASACVFNNYFDRDLDMKMERTRERGLPTGRLKPTTVLIYAIGLGIAGLGVLFAFCGVLAGLFGIVGMFVYVVVYTLWLKRTSTWSTSVGAISKPCLLSSAMWLLQEQSISEPGCCSQCSFCGSRPVSGRLASAARRSTGLQDSRSFRL